MFLSFQLALSNLQMKAEAEINKAQKLISEKDAELQAAEESLVGLKEVAFNLKEIFFFFIILVVIIDLNGFKCVILSG